MCVGIRVEMCTQSPSSAGHDTALLGFLTATRAGRQGASSQADGLARRRDARIEGRLPCCRWPSAASVLCHRIPAAATLFRCFDNVSCELLAATALASQWNSSLPHKAMSSPRQVLGFLSTHKELLPSYYAPAMQHTRMHIVAGLQ